MRANEVKRLELEQIEALVEGERNLSLALYANLAVVQCLDDADRAPGARILAQVKLAAQFQPLLSIPGVGKILALSIMLETGEIDRFAEVGNFASYARCVGSEQLSNGKKKGEGNAKSGNRYLAWAFVEAAHFAVRYNAAHPALLRAQGGQDQQHGGHQGGGAQAGAGGLSHHAYPPAFRRGTRVRLRRRSFGRHARARAWGWA